jgi:hypothetical protein
MTNSVPSGHQLLLTLSSLLLLNLYKILPSPSREKRGESNAKGKISFISLGLADYRAGPKAGPVRPSPRAPNKIKPKKKF